MNATHRYEIDGRVIHVFDGVLPPEVIAQLGTQFGRAAFVRDEADGPDTQHIRTFNANVDLAAFSASDAHDVIVSSTQALFPQRSLQLHRVHCNLTVFGDAGFPHRDCRPDRDDVTSLLFINETWRREWGGEITFFNSDEDPMFVVAPRPGRLAIFEGAIEHRVGVPLRTCYEARLSLACKFKTPGDQW